MQKIIYLIRHGESQDALSNAFQAVNTPLSEQGILQSEYLSNYVKDHSIDLIVSSPLTRAQQTAEIVARKLNQEIYTSDLFKECAKPSSLDGKSSVDNEAAAVLHKWEESLYGNGEKVLDGETFEELVTRADQALTFLTSSDCARIAVISHGFFIKTMLARIEYKNELTGEKLKTFQNSYKSDNGAITTLTYNQETNVWDIKTVNDTGYIR